MLKPKRRLTRKEMKQDKFVTFVAEATDFFNEYKQIITFGLIGIIALAAISYFMIKSRQDANLFVSGKLMRAVDYYNANDFDSAIPILQSIVDDYSGTSNAGVATYYLASSYYFKENYVEARKYYEQYQSDYGDNRYFMSGSHAGLGACYSVEGDKEAAAQSYEKAFQENPASFGAADYLFAAARNYIDVDKIPKAETLLQRIVDDFETQPVATEAKLLLSELSKKS